MSGLAVSLPGREGNDAGMRLARAAERFVGVPFRLRGRCPERGLDCVGLVAAALSAMGRKPVAPAGYRLRQTDVVQWLPAAAEAGLVEAAGEVEPGDVLLVRPGPAQHHLVIAGREGGFVHAHAGLGRVVISPAPLPWAEARRWRLA